MISDRWRARNKGGLIVLKETEIGEIKNCLRKCRSRQQACETGSVSSLVVQGVHPHQLRTRSFPEAKQISFSEQSVEAGVSLTSLAHEAGHGECETGDARDDQRNARANKKNSGSGVPLVDH